MHGTEELFPASLRPCASQDHDAYLQSFWIANTLNLARMRTHVLTMQPDMHLHNQPPPCATRTLHYVIQPRSA
jgi:hypothetical protein